MLRDALLEKAREQLGNGAVARYAAEVAEHKRDPYSLVEEIVGSGRIEVITLKVIAQRPGTLARPHERDARAHIVKWRCLDVQH